MQLSNSLTPKSISSSGYLLRQYDGAAAAYSLQRLDSSTENVVRARRSTDDAEADFTAQEVSGGSLREFSLNNDADLIRFADQATAADKRMYFDGSNDRVSTGYKADSSADFFVEATFFMDELVSFQTILCDAGSERLVQVLVNATGLLQANVFTSAGIQVVAVGSTNLSVGVVYTVRLDHDVSENRLTLTLNGVQDGTGTYTGTFTPANYGNIEVGSFPSGTLYFNGSIYDVNLNDESIYNGYGNTSADWEDQVGSNDGTVVGSPALFSGQGFDAFVTTLYDQSGALGQPLSRFAQHATAADTRMQFDGVDDDVQFAAFDLRGAVIRFTFLYVSGEAQILQMNDNANSGNLIAITLNSISDITVRLATVANAQLESYVFDSLTENTLYDLVITIASDGNSIDDATLNGLSGSSSTQTGRTQGTATANQLHLGIREDGSFPYTGLIYGVSVDGLHQWNGYGNTNADWTDQVGSNDGTVNGSPSIYEGRNALQSTASSQPQIVADGVVVTDSNGNASIDFISVTNVLETNSVLVSGTTARTVFAVVDANSVGVNESFLALSSESATSSGSIMNYTAETAVRVFGAIEFTNDPLTSLGVSAFVLPDAANITDMTFYLDGAQKTSTASSAATIDTQDTGVSQIGNYTAGGVYRVFDGKISEIIIYPSDQSANRAAIEANIASRYGIVI